MIKNYLIYLKFINEKLSNFFEEQKPYIFCKKGCAKCCKNAQFPFSQLEAFYIMQGAQKLDDKTFSRVMKNMEKIKKEKEIFKGENFLYNCPFLIDDVCCVYEYRGVICRSFGLMYVEKGVKKAPFCGFSGLNYSNVLDNSTGKISAEKFKNLKIEQEPLAHNVSYNFLTSKEFEESFKIKFGEKKPLIDWF